MLKKFFTYRDATNFQSVKVIFKLKLLWNEKLRNLRNPIFNALLFQKNKIQSLLKMELIWKIIYFKREHTQKNYILVLSFCQITNLHVIFTTDLMEFVVFEKFF